MVKTQTSISIDDELKKEYKKTRDKPLSTWIEEKLKEELNPEKQILFYQQKIRTHEKEIQHCKTRIEELLIETGQSNLYHGLENPIVERAVQTCLNIYQQHNCVGENQIKSICDLNNIDMAIVRNKLKVMEIPIISIFHPPKQAKTITQQYK